MRTKHFERLTLLAQHLKNGPLGHKVFNFNTWNSGPSLKGPVRRCGTSGCAIGECPVLFRTDWEFDPKHLLPQLRNATFRGDDPLENAAVYFGLTPDEAKVLFNPPMVGSDTVQVGPFFQLPSKTRRQGVAKQIRRFITWKKKELAK